MSARFTEPGRGTEKGSGKNPPMPGWIKAMLIPAATKQYMYQQWLAGNITLKSEPQDWGVITDVAEVLNHVSVSTHTASKTSLPNFTVEQLKKSAAAANQDNLDLQYAIATSDGVNVKFKGKTYTYEGAIARQTELTNLASNFSGAVRARHDPNGKTETTDDENLQMAVQTAKQNADSAFATLTQELTVSPSTAQPFQAAYLQTLKVLSDAENAAIDKRVDIVKTVPPGVAAEVVTATATPTATSTTTPTAAKNSLPTRAQRGESTSPQPAPVKPVSVNPSLLVEDRLQRTNNPAQPPVTPPPTGTSGSSGSGSSGTGNPGSGSSNKVLRSAVDAALKEAGLKDTPANRKLMRKKIAAAGGVSVTDPVTGVVTTTQPATGKVTTTDPKTGVVTVIKPGTATPAVGGNAWEARFKTEYPGYAWMFTDEIKSKYPDTFALFEESTKPGFDINLFDRKFQGTSWYTMLAQGKTGRELTGSVGSFTWGSGNLAKFLTNATRMNWTGENLKAEAYKELFSKGADGKYVNDLAIKEVQASTPYLKLKKIGTSFFSPMSDERIIESLTGGISTDDVLRLARERAKIIYPHLASAIDAGLTLDDISYDYKRIAAETLELSPDAVDMSSAKFNKAMKFGEGGKERMMSTGEFESLIRTDPNYGYQFTKTANNDATELGLSLARAFGKVG